MARRRGPSNQERLALDIITVTATGTVLVGPCFVYQLMSTLTETTATGRFSVGDSSASADVIKESSKLNFKFGTSGVSAQALDYAPRVYNPPLYFAQNLFWNVSTGIASVSFQYIAAS